MNQNKAKLWDCFKSGQEQSIENSRQNLVLTSDTLINLLDSFSLKFFCPKFLVYLFLGKRKRCLVSYRKISYFMIHFLV